jgi:23S rRNA G2069 N7-methylase RlmK/C1962 C5-methylase RlmI
MDEKVAGQAEMLANRLKKRFRHLSKWAKRSNTNAFRLYDRDIPEIPLVLDLYGDAVSGALYSRPYEKDRGEEARWLEAMRGAVAQGLGLAEGNVFLKERQRIRHRQESGDQYGRLSNQGCCRDVREGDMVFRVNLSDYLDTGLFLDARKRRALIRKEAAGKRVLNLFAYTCSVSVAAAKGGARQVDSVDLSNTYLEWGRINFALNGLAKPLAAPSLIRDDALQFISRAAQEGLCWDIIVLDPPSFSNSKKMQDTLDMRRDHGELIQSCLSILGPGGTLWFSSSAKGISLNSDDFPACTVKDMGPYLVDEDFKGKRMPKTFLLTNNV